MSHHLLLRPATMDDAEIIWRWRNDPLTRAMFRNSEEVPWEAHLKWCASVIADPKRLLLLAEYDGTPCAVVRFDDKGDGVAEVNINVSPEWRGKGIAKQVLKGGTQDAFLYGWKTVIARIKPENSASIKSFKRAGYVAASGLLNEAGEIVYLKSKDGHRHTLRQR